MIKYIVVHVTTEPTDPDGAFEGGLDEDELYHPEVKEVILCQDKAGVGKAIKSTEKLRDGSFGMLDWAVFEVNGSKTERRSVIFEKDGKVRSIQ